MLKYVGNSLYHHDIILDAEVMGYILRHSSDIIFGYNPFINTSFNLYVLRNSSDKNLLGRIFEIEPDLIKRILLSDNESDIDRLFEVHKNDQEKIQNAIKEL